MARVADRKKSYAMPPPRPPTVVIAPDSFKGSLDAPAICAAIARGLRRVWPDADLRACPMADGGEGTLDAVLSRGGQRRTMSVSGAGGRQRAAAYGIVAAPEGSTAIVEAAQIVGITDGDGMTTAVTARSTRGMGEMIAALLDEGVRRFMIGLGGSSTNDGGAGMLTALGLRVVDAAGRDVAPTPQGLAAIARADANGLDPRLAESSITIMSDVNNPLCGERGATAIFGPQKGVRPEEIAAIDATLAGYAGLAERAVGKSAADRPGAGAAGGLGFALQLVGGSFRSGAEVVADLIGLDAALERCDLGVDRRRPHRHGKRCSERRHSSSPSARARPAYRSRCFRARSTPPRSRSSRNTSAAASRCRPAR